MPTTYWYAAVATGQCNQRGLRGLHRQALLFAVPSGPIGLLVQVMVGLKNGSVKLDDIDIGETPQESSNGVPEKAESNDD